MYSVPSKDCKICKLSEFGFKNEEWLEIERFTYDRTHYPAPVCSHRLVRITSKISIEEPYYWIIDQLKQTWSYHRFDKIVDLFAASEQSALFGVAQQRLGLQQDKVSQFLATIGKMIKELFQLVRELRILDERLSYYERSKKGDKSADITLKGIWIDMVEGGSKNPSSVYGMAAQLGFVTLPDLFFSTMVQSPDEVDKKVEALDFNRKVKEVLKRKLMTFITWRESTYKELKVRRVFTLKYLRQHYNAIKMYIEWVKPYLRNIRRMQLNEKLMDSASLVSAFESSAFEVEFLAIKTGTAKKGKYYPCVLVTFDYRTKPSLSYHQEGYQRGPIHIGEVHITLRGYAWTEEQIENYKKYRESEAFEILYSINDSLKSAMEALGDELKKYLEQSGEKVSFKSQEENKEQKPKKQSVFEPLTSAFKGFSQIKELFAGTEKKKAFEDASARKAAEADVKNAVWQTYKNYKKAHKPFMAW